MADSFSTLADLVKINDANLAEIDVTDLMDQSPLVGAMAAVIASNGTDHKYVKETTAPTVGFRSANDGRENSKSADTLVTLNLKILDASFAVDAALAHEYRAGVDAYIEREARRHLKAAIFSAEQQILQGTAAAAAGFSGLPNSGDMDAVADAQVIDAGGTTADTGSSVYLIRSADDGVALVTGNDGLIQIGESVSQRLTGSSGSYPAYFTPITGWLSLQLGSKFDSVRIANLTADSGKGLTDALLAEAVSKFPAGMPPTHIICSRRSLNQLRDSRTATNATGAEAPFPESAFGAAVVVSDGLTDTEALIS